MTAKVNRIQERGAAGDYSDLVVPIDYMILDRLEPEGTTMSGMYPIGSTTKAVGKSLPSKVPSSQLAARIRVMNMLGLVIKVKSLGGGQGTAAWQRSAKAEELLKKWKEQSNGS